MASIFATTAEVLRKAGANASATSSAAAYVDDYMTQVESHINIHTRNNWSDSYAALNADVQGLLKECASNLAAIYVITYDMSGFTTLLEAQTILDVLRDRANYCLKLLEDKKKEKFMTNA